MRKEAATTVYPLLGVATTGATSWIKLKLLRKGGGGMIDSITKVAMTTAQ